MITLVAMGPIFYFVLILVTLILCGRILFTGRAFSPLSAANIFLLLSEFLFTIIAPTIGFMRYDQYGPSIPFSRQEVLSVIMVVVFSSACFWLVRILGDKLREWWSFVLSGGITLGILLCFATTLHFGGYNMNGLIFPLLGFELLSPFVCIFILLKQLVVLFGDPVLRQAEDEEISSLDVPVKESTRRLRSVTWKRIGRSLLPAAVLLILFIIADAVIGLGYDSLFKAYTDSIGFVFSTGRL